MQIECKVPLHMQQAVTIWKLEHQYQDDYDLIKQVETVQGNLALHVLFVPRIQN